jgi:hypothetical protein
MFSPDPIYDTERKTADEKRIPVAIIVREPIIWEDFEVGLIGELADRPHDVGGGC